MENYKISLEFDRVLALMARYIKTAAGRELLYSIPECADEAAIYSRFTLLGEIKTLISFDSKLYFDDIEDYRDSLKRLRIDGYLFEPALLYKLSKTLDSVTQIRNTAFKYREKYPALWKTACDIGSYQKIYSEIFRCVDNDGGILDAASPKLASIRREITVLASRVQNKLRELINNIKVHARLSEDYVTIREGRFVIPLPVSEQSRVKGIIHDYSQSRSTVFMEPVAIMSENNALRELKEDEAVEINRIIFALNEMVKPEANGIINSLGIVFALDRDNAIANFCVTKNCENVKVSNDGELEIINGRHPLLKDGCVPLNLKISRSHDILLLSGPNAGGKTVLLKTIGLFCVMARCGIPIPANASTVLPFIDRMFVDIGDSQSITENLSTFSGHIKFLSGMIDGIEDPRRTMVLLDELGTGSAPNYSSAIACAIIWRLAEARVKSVITTHFSGVVDYAYSLDNAINGSLEFDITTLRPTYRLIMGIPGASYAIHIAKNYGLQQFIIDKASEFLDKNEVRYEELISELIKYSSDLKGQYQKVMAESESVKKIERRLLDTEKAFKKTRREVEDELREEYEKKYTEMLLKVNAAVSARDADMKETRKKLGAEIASEKKAIAANAYKKDGEGDNSKGSPGLSAAASFPYGVSDIVTIEKLNSSGIVKEIDLKKRQAKVELKNKMEMWVKFSMISGTQENLAEFEDAGVISYNRDAFSINRELDIRGMKCEDGIEELERYLIKASENRFESVRIIHGKGTLALKAAVESHLRQSRFVSSFRTGKLGEGDYGVTLVEIKF